MFARAAQELSTVRDILRFAVSRFNDAELFFGHGSDNAHDEAAYLILHTLNLPLDTLEPYLDAKLLQSEKEEVLGLIERRVTERVPVAYLTHQAWQGDFDFYVDERVIVPRSFIYELLGDPLLPWIEHNELVHRALDLCTGSGCLAIQMAHHYPAAEIDAVDLSLDALEVAAVNIEEYGLEERVRLIRRRRIGGNPARRIPARTRTRPRQRHGRFGRHPPHHPARRQTPQSARRTAGGNRPQPRHPRSHLSRAAVHLVGNQRRRRLRLPADTRTAFG